MNERYPLSLSLSLLAAQCIIAVHIARRSLVSRTSLLQQLEIFFSLLKYFLEVL